MLKMMLFLECGIGTKTCDAVLVPEEMFDTEGLEIKELSSILWQSALDHASAYGIYPTCDQPDDYDENGADWHSDEYSDDIEAWLEPYDPEKHDGHMFGNMTEWDWKRI